MHGIALDAVHDEIVAPNPFAEAILFFRGGANGEEPPLRIIQGPKTKLRYPDIVAVDPLHNEVFVPQSSPDSILVFSREANGDVEPIRIIHGPKTKLDGPDGLAVDYINDLLIVNNSESFLIFNRTDNGDVAPRAIVPTVGGGSGRRIALYPQGKKIFLRLSEEGGDAISVWQYTAGQDVDASLWAVIKDTTHSDLSIRGIGLNPGAKEVLTINREGGKPSAAALYVYHVPEVFE